MSQQLSIFEERPSAFAEMLRELPANDDDGLRYYQVECKSRIEKALETNRSALIVMATGTGKTVVFVNVAKYWPGSVLILAHRDELVEQAKAALERATGEYVEIEKAYEVSSPKTRLVVGSVQSFNKKRRDRLGKDRFSLIIIDEAHHAPALSYMRIIEFFTARILGVTATPDRTDEKALGKIFDEVAYVFDIQEGIEAGYLVPLKGHRIVIESIKLDDVKKKGGDLDADELDVQMAKNIDAIVQETLRLTPEKQAICFFPGVRSAELAANKFNEYEPGSATFVSGFTDKDERAGIMAAFKQHRVRYLCNCQIATEGFDAPGTSVIVLARPTLSRALYAQMIGRGTRVLPGVVEHLRGPLFAKERRESVARSLKPSCTILDFVGNSQKHDLMTAVDVLGGNYSEAEVKEAKKRVKSGQDVSDALAEARAKLKKLAAKTKVEVKAAVHPFDPFKVLGLNIEAEDRYAGRFGGRGATPGMKASLLAKGVPDEQIVNISYRAAQRLLNICYDRQKQGLATYKQLRQLQRRGFDDTNVTFDAASKALDYIGAREGWKGAKAVAPIGPVDPKVVWNYLHRLRQPGED
jgi:superfamily II DNA or RNA helicase